MQNKTSSKLTKEQSSTKYNNKEIVINKTSKNISYFFLYPFVENIIEDEVVTNTYLFHNKVEYNKTLVVNSNKLFRKEKLIISDEDYNNFLNGSYSKFSKEAKNKIIAYYEKYKGANQALKMFYILNPDIHYFRAMSDYYDVSLDTIRNVGEVFSIFNPEKETWADS